MYTKKDKLENFLRELNKNVDQEFIKSCEDFKEHLHRKTDYIMDFPKEEYKPPPFKELTWKEPKSDYRWVKYPKKVVSPWKSEKEDQSLTMVRLMEENKELKKRIKELEEILNHPAIVKILKLIEIK